MEKFLTRTPREFLGLTRTIPDPAVVASEHEREAYRYAKVSFRFILSVFRIIFLHSQTSSFYARNLTVSIIVSLELGCLISRHARSRLYGMIFLTSKRTPATRSALSKVLLRALRKSITTSYDLRSLSIGKFLPGWVVVVIPHETCSFQARIGNMDGVFVTYHNTERIFGFQYVPLSEMDARLFGERAAGDVIFEKCLLLLEAVLDEATRELPCQVYIRREGPGHY